MKLEKYRFGLTTFVYFFVVVFACMFIEGMDFFKDGYSAFTLKDTLFASSCMLIGIVFILFLEIRRNRAKIDWLILPFILLLTVISLVGIYEPYIAYWSSGVAPTEYYNLTNTNLVFCTLATIFGNTLLYISLAIIPKRIAKVNSLAFIYWFIVAVGLFAIVYSLIVEKESYRLIFSGEAKQLGYNSIKSFFINENNYGQLLLLCIIAVLLLNACKPHWWHFIFVAVLFIGMIFSTSLTSIVITLVALFSYLLYEMIYTFKRHTVRNLAYFTGVIFGVTGIIILFVILAKEQVPFFVEIQEFIVERILDKNFTTASGRVGVWKRALETLQTPTQWLFGLGGYQAIPYVGQYTLVNYGRANFAIDSGIIEVLVTHGIIGLVVYITILACFIALCIVLTFRRKQKLGVPILIFTVSLTVYSMFESLIFFRINTIGMVTLGLLFMPALIQYNKTKTIPVVETNVMSIRINAHKLTSSQIVTLYAFPPFLLASFFITALTIPSFISNKLCVVIIALSALVFFTLPYLVAMIRRKSIGKWFLLKFIILLSLILAIPGICFLVTLFVNKSLIISLIVGGSAYLFVFLVLTVFYFLTVSSVKEFFALVFKDLILTYLFPVLTYLIVIIPLTFLVISLNASFTAYIFYLGTSTLIFFIMMLYVPSPFKSNKKFIRLIDELNARLLLSQRMVFVLDK